MGAVGDIALVCGCAVWYGGYNSGGDVQTAVPSSILEGGSKTTPPSAGATVSMTPETRGALTMILLQRSPHSQEEADEVLAQHGFPRAAPASK